MDLIQKNPYRILGLLAGSSAAVQNRQVKRLKQFIEAEQDPEEDYSFPTLGHLKRTTEDIEYAVSKLNLDADKLEAALFWFYQGNPISDDPSFDALKLNDESSAAEIWRNLVIDEDTDEIKLITKRNASAFHNLSTYYLTEYGFDEEALRFKLLFIESEFFKDFLNQVTDKTYTINQTEAQILFLITLFKSAGDDQYDFIDTLTEINYIAKEEFHKIAVKSPIEEIDSEIKQTKLKRQSNKANSISIGLAFHNTVKLKLDLVEILLGENNITYHALADKVADEILQCGIDYFVHFKSSEKDPSSDSLRLFNIAELIAKGNITLQRIAENTENLEEWANNASERGAQEKAKEDFEELINIFQEFDNKAETVKNARSFIIRCKPRLNNISNILGPNEDLYVKLNERVANQTLNNVVGEINEKQADFSTKMKSYDPNTKMILDFGSGTLQFKSGLTLVSDFQSFVSDSIEVLKLIQTLNPNEKFVSERFRPNYQAINKLNTDLLEMMRKISNAPSSFDRKPQVNNSGCYIATMAYGDYDHPQVLILRDFRDEKLDKTLLGRLFIKLYYTISPHLVQILKNHKKVNLIIRSGLDLVISKYLIK